MLQYQFLPQRGWRRKVDFFQPPKNACFSFDQKFSSNGRLSRKIYGRLSPPKGWSWNPVNSFCVGSHLRWPGAQHMLSKAIEEKNLMAKSGHQIRGVYSNSCKQPSGKIPSYINKFVNHLMVGGKKGVAIDLFVAALHLFFKRLEEEKRLDDLRKKSFPIKNAVFSPLLSPTSVAKIRSEGSPLKSLMLSVNSSQPFSFLQRPGKNLLGLTFSPPSMSLTRGRIPFLASSFKKQVAPNLLENKEDKVFQETLPFTREIKPSRKDISIMQESCISTVSLSFALNRQRVRWPGVANEPLAIEGVHCGEKDSIASNGSRNTLFFQPVVENKVASNSSWKDQAIRGSLATPSMARGGQRAPGHRGGGQRARCSAHAEQGHRGAEASSCKDPSLLSCLELAVKNVEPSLEVRKKKIAGITRQIPCTVAKPRGQGLAIRWIITAAQEKRRREGKAFYKSLAEELVNAYYKKGEPRQKRDSLHRIAESNRSFLRYRWW